jgi:cobalt-precorrin 5A hydrolase
VKIALISLSNEGARIAAALISPLSLRGRGVGSEGAEWEACDVFLHAGVTEMPQARRFERIVDLTREVFALYQGLIYIAPAGVVVRAIAPCIRDKTTDPAVVVVDVGGRWAVSLLSGHEGGANELALAVANAIGAEPVISTTTEAIKDLIVGIGCRRGAGAEAIVAAVRKALAMAGCELSRVRLLASAEIKADEPGLQQAARELGLPLRLIAADEIRHTAREFAHSEFVQEKVDLPAVAEPAALLAGRRTRLILTRQILHGVTVAIARESCMSLA